MPFGELAAAAIPTIGSLGAAAIQRRWALKDWERVNSYNHPKEQIKRLQEAGLPLASMFSGSGGSTSTDVRSSQVDPSLGTAQGMSNYFTTRLQRKQLQLMDEQIGKAEADKTISQVAANEALINDIFYRGPKYDVNGYLITGNRQLDNLELTMRQKEAETKTKEVMADLTRAKTQAEIDHVLSTIRLGNQQLKYNEVMQLVDKITIDRMKDGKGISGIEAMLYNFFIKRGSVIPR